ncbi:MAG: PDZ domain-containing protein, partial [Planctomycetes bacterium]|nr:PDZ domain-containing protein [Planctomycetota bacterium]
EWMDAGRKASLRPVLGMTVRFAAGLRVDEVVAGTPAAAADLQSGDIIERVGNARIESAANWVEFAVEKGIKEEDVLRLKRGGKRVDVKISVPSFGARVFGQGGARIVELVEGGLAFNAGLKPNDVIVKVGPTKVEGTLDFANALMMASANDETVLEVKRGFSRELIKFSYSTGDAGGSGGFSRDEWKQGDKLLALWEKLVAEKSAGAVFPLRQRGKQVAFATVVRKDGLLVTKASQINPAEKFELVDGTTSLEASIVARNDRYDLAVIRVNRQFTREIVFKARPQEVPPIGTLLGTVDAKGKSIAHGFVALPEYNTDKIVGEPDPNGPFMGLAAKDADGGGAEITSVTPNQPADKGGLKVGDVVKKINGQPVADWASMLGIVQSRRPDETITLDVIRGGQPLELKVTLVPRAQALGQAAPSKGTGKPELGIGGCRARDGGAEIGFVRPGSPAELAGVSSGEILLRIDDTAVTDQRSVDAVINSRKIGDKVSLTLRRDGKEVKVEVELAEQDAPPPPPGGGRPNVKGPINDRYTHLGKVIQHDGVVLPSQQGSPVFDLEGNVIGLNIARADRTRTFALSAQRVSEVLTELLKQVGERP